MSDQGDVRRIVLSLPDTHEADDHFGFYVRAGSTSRKLVWAWNERVVAGTPRVARPDVLAIRVADLHEKEALLASDSERFFTEPHYDGYRAVLVRLPLIDLVELRELIVAAWSCQAPRRLVAAFEAGRPRRP